MRFERSDWKSDEASLNKQLGLLAAAIRVETFGKEFYQRMSECIKDREGKLILRSLSRDEKEHRAWLTRQIDRIFPGKDVTTIRPDPEYANVVPGKVFPDLPEGACLSAKDEMKAVEMAIGVEKASVRMYEQVASLTQDLELKILMQRLAQWEREHQRTLEENLEYLKRGGSWYGYNPILDG
ncbi:MAG: ferritin family protein [Methanomassiliicoccus sp.]|nr:ferritin family protein [Methanomassiliicoccus sp.]